MIQKVRTVFGNILRLNRNLKPDEISVKSHQALQEKAASNMYLKRLAWFVGLWIASVLALGIVAYGLKLWLK